MISTYFNYITHCKLGGNWLYEEGNHISNLLVLAVLRNVKITLAQCALIIQAQSQVSEWCATQARWLSSGMTCRREANHF